MSTWVVNDFDEPFEQTFSIGRLTSFDSLRIKCLKIGTVNASATFTFQITDGSEILFNQTIDADFINSNLSDNGNRADLVFSIDSFVLNHNIDNSDHEYQLKFLSENYTTSENSRFMVCRRQEEDRAVPITGITGLTPEQRAVQMPIFFEIFRWSKDSKQ